MPFSVAYGTDRSFVLGESPGRPMWELGGRALDPPVEASSAVRAALENPLEFPRITQATVPGDRITIAVLPRTSAAPTVVAGLLAELASAGAEAEQFTVLQSLEDATAGAPDPRSGLPDAERAQVALRVHDPDDRGELAYLAATQAGDAVYLNRALVDADLVVPIGPARPVLAGLAGVDGSALYPEFSDRATHERYRGPQRAKSGRSATSPREEIDEVAWLLGTQFSVEVVPGSGDSLAAVVAGERQAVRRRAQQLADARWRFPVERAADLIVAAVDGPAWQQTWDQVIRAMWSAAAGIGPGGEIAVCTSLAAEPGPALACLADEDDRLARVKSLARERHSDWDQARLLAGLLDRHRVYLLSDLDQSVVESLGLVYVESAEEIIRLSGRHASCAILPHAQHAVLVGGEL